MDSRTDAIMSKSKKASEKFVTDWNETDEEYGFRVVELWKKLIEDVNYSTSIKLTENLPAFLKETYKRGYIKGLKDGYEDGSADTVAAMAEVERDTDD